MKRALIVLCCALLFTPVAHARYMAPPKHASLQHQVAFWERAKAHYGYVCVKGKPAARRKSHCSARAWAVRELHKVRVALFRASLPPHYSAWLCLERYENGGYGWHANTGNGYYGGLQFLASTWSRNGGLRYAPAAYLATPLQQMWTAENAWRESGGSFSQWSTRGYCGLQ